MTTFVSSSLQYVFARPALHSLSESVHFASLSFLGLVSLFHNVSPVLFYLFISTLQRVVIILYDRFYIVNYFQAFRR